MWMASTQLACRGYPRELPGVRLTTRVPSWNAFQVRETVTAGTASPSGRVPPRLSRSSQRVALVTGVGTRSNEPAALYRSARTFAGASTVNRRAAAMMMRPLSSTLSASSGHRGSSAHSARAARWSRSGRVTSGARARRRSAFPWRSNGKGRLLQSTHASWAPCGYCVIQ